MKKCKVILLAIIAFLLLTPAVYAQNTVYSRNKNKDEKLTHIKHSYNDKGNKEGFAVAGSYLNEKDENNTKNYEVMLINYQENGKVKWEFTYDKKQNSIVEDLEYTYNEENNIDGYLIVLGNNSTEQEEANKPIFLKIDLDGKLVWEKDFSINQNDKIYEINETHNDEGNLDGYIAIGSNKIDKKALLIKYDKNCDLIWKKEYTSEEYKEINNKDIINIKDNGKEIGYAVIRESITQNKELKAQIVRYNKDGDEEQLINDNLEKYDKYALGESNNGFLLYGITSEVKLDQGNKSYFIINYNSNNEQIWETIGNSPVSKGKNILLLPVKKENLIKKYLLLYSNSTDKSIEVIKISIEGTIETKVKKIKNDYYDIENFAEDKGVLYLVGQINCPKDDDCEYNTNSLFIISDEDKVIEVKDNDSKTILIVLIVFIITIISITWLRRKKKLKSN